MKTPEDGTVILTREELYERVWTTAMRHLGPELGISDVGLKKICEGFKIPTPPVGYWAKTEYGKAPRRPKLPDYDDPQLKGIKFYPNTGQCELSAEVEGYARREKLPEKRIEVPAILGDPDPMVERTLRSLKAARAGDDGLVHPRAKSTLRVCVAPGNVDRAMLIMDSLLKALENRQLQVQLEAKDERYTTMVNLLGEAIYFRLGEHVQREEREPTPSEETTGRGMADPIREETVLP